MEFTSEEKMCIGVRFTNAFIKKFMSDEDSKKSISELVKNKERTLNKVKEFVISHIVSEMYNDVELEKIRFNTLIDDICHRIDINGCDEDVVTKKDVFNYISDVLKVLSKNTFQESLV